MKNIPQKIYLQIDPENGDPEDFNELSEISWCQNRIHRTDVAYFSKELAIEFAVWITKGRYRNTTIWEGYENQPRTNEELFEIFLTQRK